MSLGTAVAIDQLLNISKSMFNDYTHIGEKRMLLIQQLDSLFTITEIRNNLYENYSLSIVRLCFELSSSSRPVQTCGVYYIASQMLADTYMSTTQACNSSRKI
jgi:hypothetical protein